MSVWDIHIIQLRYINKYTDKYVHRYQLLVLWEVYAQLTDINTQEDISHSNKEDIYVLHNTLGVTPSFL